MSGRLREPPVASEVLPVCSPPALSRVSACARDESKNLKRELLRAREEVKRIQSVPLVIGQFIEMIDDAHGIVSSTAGQNHYVRILSTINRELLKPVSGRRAQARRAMNVPAAYLG